MDVTNLKTALSEGVVKVSFTKVDGERRDMTCSLSSALLPQPKIDSESKKRHNDDVLAVFDTEKQAWRSFRIDSVIEWSYVK
jgi:hypothetical protein